MTDQTDSGSPGRPVTYDKAETAYTVVTARKRYEELAVRDLSAGAAATLRERGEFNADELGHRLLAESAPLTVTERLALMAAGEVLARHYRHPSMLDQAVKAGATWDQIGAARGTSADQARRDYPEWAEGQHSLQSYEDGRFGMSDEEYAAAGARSGVPEASAATWRGRQSTFLDERPLADHRPEVGREAGQ